MSGSRDGIHYRADSSENRAKRRTFTRLSLAEIDLSNRHRDSTDIGLKHAIVLL